MTPLHVDTLLKNAEIFDGSGARPFQADVAIAGKHIAAIDKGLVCKADRILDCSGLALVPGFIDTHTHDDRALLKDRSLHCKISQGITTVVLGNCGISLMPFAGKTENLPDPFGLIAENDSNFFKSSDDYFRHLKEQRPTVNYAALVGHSLLRLSAGTPQDRKAKKSEISFMASELDKALSEGAKGLSLGLEYSAGNAASSGEIASLLSVLNKHKAILTAHIRSESAQIVAAIDEVASLAKGANVPLVISHLKCSGSQNFGKSVETLQFIEALAEEQKILFDAYPYAVGMTVLSEKFVTNSPKTIISSSLPHPEQVGKDIRDIARSLGCTLREAIQRISPATALYYVMDENDVRNIVAHPLGMIGSDGIHNTAPHPRLWGTFPRFFGRYVRDLRLLEWEEAIRKTTSLPAKIFSLSRRGEVKKGFFADLVLFDKSTIRDEALFEKPEQKSSGIVSVFVNGSLAWHEGRATGIYAGERA